MAHAGCKGSLWSALGVEKFYIEIWPTENREQRTEENECNSLSNDCTDGKLGGMGQYYYLNIV